MSKRQSTTRTKEITADAILVLSETRKIELRQSEDYRQTRKILGNIFDNIKKLKTKIHTKIQPIYKGGLSTQTDTSKSTR